MVWVIYSMEILLEVMRENKNKNIYHIDYLKFSIDWELEVESKRIATMIKYS